MAYPTYLQGSGPLGVSWLVAIPAGNNSHLFGPPITTEVADRARVNNQGWSAIWQPSLYVEGTRRGFSQLASPSVTRVGIEAVGVHA